MSYGKVVKRGKVVHSRSGLERAIRAGLDRDKVPYEYESCTFDLFLSAIGSICPACGHKPASQKTRYTPDFHVYPNTSGAFFVEAKGRFTGRDRRKALAIKDQWSKEDVRYVFMRDNKLSKNSKTTYTKWCKDNGLKYHVGRELPKEWLK